MTISAKIVEDSISQAGHRLTTFLLRYPRWIHAEGRTHRQLRIGEEWEFPTPSLMEDPNLSRNASSSRAIPVERLIEDVLRDTAIPMFWGKNQRGMQANEECRERVFYNDPLSGRVRPVDREEAWLVARDYAVKMARAFAEAGYHKQVVNRLLEPFSHINVVVTATEWSNFFALRRHKDAEPHIRLLADLMYSEMQASVPRLLLPGGWHLPFVKPSEHAELSLELRLLVSTARCARTSYLTHDQREPRVEEDVLLAQRLLSSVPLHASPAEHQGTPDTMLGPLMMWANLRLHGNFKGFIQHRKTLEGECQ